MAFKMKAGKEGPMRKNFGKDIAPMNFNAGLRAASKAGKLDNNPKFKAAVDNAPTKMITQGGYTGKGKKYSSIDEAMKDMLGPDAAKRYKTKKEEIFKEAREKRKKTKPKSKIKDLAKKTIKTFPVTPGRAAKLIKKAKTKKVIKKATKGDFKPAAKQVYKAIKKEARTGNITKQIKGIAKDIKKDDVFKMKKKESPKKILGSLMGPLGGLAAKALGNKKVRKGVGRVGGTMLQALGGPLGGMAGKAMGGMLMKKAPNKMKKKK